MKTAIVLVSTLCLVAAFSQEAALPGGADGRKFARDDLERVAGCLGLVQSVRDRGIEAAQVLTARTAERLVEKGYLAVRDQARRIAGQECAQLDLDACLEKMDADHATFFQAFEHHKRAADRLGIELASHNASMACSTWGVGHLW